MLKRCLIAVVVLLVIGSALGEDDDLGETAGGLGEALIAEAEAGEATPGPAPTETDLPKTTPGKAKPAKARKPARQHRTDRAQSEKTRSLAPPPVKRRPQRTYLVARVVDGDTVELGNGEHVRIVGIDTPERGECGFAEAASNMERLVLGKRVRLRPSDEDRDRYGRLLRYVDVRGRDAGLDQLERGLAVARYDSRDGYGYHPRENRYIATDKATPDFRCRAPRAPRSLLGPAGGGAKVSYENCDAARAAGAAPVRRGDPGYGGHLDRDGDGVGCE